MQDSHKHDNEGGQSRAAVAGNSEQLKIAISPTSKLLLCLEKDMNI